MRPTRLALMAGGAVGAAVLVAAILGVPGGRPASRPAGTATSVSAGGITLASAAIELPTDDPLFPAGAHADIVDANCTGCHSAAMALTQPPLSADQWRAEVTKMREVYRAPVAAADVPAILGYLAAMPGQKAAKGDR